MEKLLKLYDKLKAEKQSLQLDLAHDKIADWTLQIFHGDSQTIIFEGQHLDLDFLGSQAYVDLYNWFLDEFNYLP